MKIKALITTLVLGSSSVALAAPQVRDHRAPTTVVTSPPPPVKRPIGQNHIAGRVDARPIRPRPQPATWVTLADNLAVNGRSQIQLNQRTRAFKKLELRAQGNGRTAIDKVIVTFANGRSQTVNLGANLTKKKSSVAIDLAGDSRFVDRIVLVGKSSGRNASVDVLAL